MLIAVHRAAVNSVYAKNWDKHTVSKYNLSSTGAVYILGLVVYLITSSRGAVVLPHSSPGSKLNELSEFP